MIRKNKTLLISAVVLALALTTALAGTLVFAQPASAAAAPAAGNTVSVNGNALVTIKPDIAYATFGTLTFDVNAAKARTDNDVLMKKVLDAVKAQGVDEKDIRTVNFSINPRYNEDGSAVTGYEVTNSIEVTVRKLDKLGAIMDGAITAGANTANNLTFDVEKREEAYNQALVKAIENAKARAETLAKSAGRGLGAVVSVVENGSYTPSPVYYSGAKDMAAGAPVSAGNLEINAAVSVTYELK